MFVADELSIKSIWRQLTDRSYPARYVVQSAVDDREIGREAHKVLYALASHLHSAGPLESTATSHLWILSLIVTGQRTRVGVDVRRCFRQRTATRLAQVVNKLRLDG